MVYREIVDGENFTVIEVSEFKNGDGVAEYNLIIKSGSTLTPGEDVIKRLTKSCSDFSQKDGICAIPVFKRFFLPDGLLSAEQSEKLALQERASVIGQPPLNSGSAVLWAYLRTDVTLKNLSPNFWETSHNGYSHLWFANGVSPEEGPWDQTFRIFGNYTEKLGEKGCSLARNCIRTWLYVADIDNNYPSMVRARNEFFADHGLNQETHFIASTGIDGRPLGNDNLVQMDAYAINGLRDCQIKYLHGASHLNPTIEYGVSFERGTVVAYGDRIHVFISGTASIDNRGEIVGVGDIIIQTERTLENISVLLREAGCGFGDVAQMLVYIRREDDFGAVDMFLSTHFSKIPKVILHAPVCREGWLIEIECIAIKERRNPGFRNL